MKITEKQEELSRMLSDNFFVYSTNLSRLLTKSHDYAMESIDFAHSVSQLVDKLNRSMKYLKELEAESYRVADREQVKNHE